MITGCIVVALECAFNKLSPAKVQCTFTLHVDDIFASSTDPLMLDALARLMQDKYHEYRRQDGPVLGYLGMTFDFSTPGEAKVTMDGYILDLISSCDVKGGAKTPASENLFDIRESGVPGNLLATPAEAKWFHSFVAKILYAAKRILPECLTTVAFLATRVHHCAQDDLKKLIRLLRYIIATAGRGVILRPGVVGLEVRAWIDAAYGVHSDGKSHTGSAITVGEASTVHAKSGKQHNVTKSSTEAELVGLSDSANQGFHIRNFILAQGYDIGPLILYQDNLSTMALIDKGRSSSERTRHIAIRHFWLKERISLGEAQIVHMKSELLFANLLTKPLQGPQFLSERKGLTNW